MLFSKTSPARFMAATALTFACLSTFNAANAQSTTFYSENFESRTNYPEWSSNMTRNTQARSAFTAFNGRNGRQNIVLSLGALPALPTSGTNGSSGTGGTSGSNTGNNTGGFTVGTGSPNTPTTNPIITQLSYIFTLSFDLYILDSWDGNEATYGIDKLLVRANNALIFNQSFSNQAGNPQSFAGTPTQSGSNLGFHYFNDSIYRNIAINFTIPAGQPLTLLFTDTLAQSLEDESWGIDNINVSYSVVPTPGTAALAGFSALFAARRRR